MKNIILMLAILTGTTAIAAPISLSLTTASGTPGSVVTIFATVTNTSGVSQPLGGDSATLQSPLQAFNDSLFINNWPLSLDAAGANASYGPAALFTVTIANNAALGQYKNNTYNLFGSANNLLLSQQFEVDVVSSAPEPATAWMVFSAFAAAAGFARLRKV